MTAGIRRSGRAFALQLLYARDGDPGTDLIAPASSWATDFELEVEAPAQQFARDLVAAAVSLATEID